MGLRDGVELDVAVDVGREADEGPHADAPLIEAQRQARFLSRGHEIRDVRRPGGVGAPMVADVAAVHPQGGRVRGAVKAQDDALPGKVPGDAHRAQETDHRIRGAGGPDRVHEGEGREALGGRGRRDEIFGGGLFP